MNPLNPNYLKRLGLEEAKRKREMTSLQQTARKKANQPSTQRDTASSPSSQRSLDLMSVQFPLPNPKQAAISSLSGRLSGRALIVFPEGILANCNILEGALHEWTVICQKNIYCNISSFRKGRFQGKQFSYDMEKGVMSESIYKQGKLQSVLRCLDERSISFQKFVGDKALMQLVTETYDGIFLEKHFPCVESSEGKYFGQKIGNIPEGLGVLLTQNQLFYGQFQMGLLSGRGVMSFDGGHYIGELQNGVMKGLGLFSTAGKQKYKYQTTPIDQKDFASALMLLVSSFKEFKELQIFEPIIDFYHKLRQMYIKKPIEMSQSASLIDIKAIQIEDLDENNSQSKKSSHPTERAYQDTWNEFKRSNTGKPASTKDKVSFTQRGKINLTNIKGQQKIEGPQKPKESEKIFKTTPRMNDYQWNQIIEELTEESIPRQGSFIDPPRGSTKEKQSPYEAYPKSQINARTGRQNLVKIHEDDSFSSDQQNRKINKIFGKYSKPQKNQ